MKLNLFIYNLLFLVIISCSDAPQQIIAVQNKIEEKPIEKNKPGSNFPDTLTINLPAAVFYSPDSLQLEKIKSVTSANVFDGIMHEDFYLMRNAHIVIRKYYPKLKIIEAKNVRYLLFIKADKSTDCIDLDTKKDVYGLIAFNRKQPPLVVDMANIDSELGFYFPK